VRDARGRYHLGLLMVALGTACFSAGGYFTRLITVDTWTMVFWRSLFGALTALLCIAIQSRGRIWTEFAALGSAGWVFSVTGALCMLSFLAALRLTTVAHVGIIYATLPFVAALMAWVVLHERTDGATLLASFVAFAGVLLTLAAGLGEGDPWGDLLGMTYTLLMAAAIVMARRRRAFPMIPAACAAAALAALMAFPLATFGPVGWRDMLEMALFGASNLGVGMILVSVGCRLIPAVETALISALETPLAPLWVWLAFDERPQATTLAGGALVMAAVVAHVTFGARRQAVQP